MTARSDFNGEGKTNSDFLQIGNYSSGICTQRKLFLALNIFSAALLLVSRVARWFIFIKKIQFG
jgi:hypothetical protein